MYTGEPPSVGRRHLLFLPRQPLLPPSIPPPLTAAAFSPPKPASVDAFSSSLPHCCQSECEREEGTAGKAIRGAIGLRRTDRTCQLAPCRQVHVTARWRAEGDHVSTYRAVTTR
uniref:Uncharacterized protein n=1 Tax=Arundo donax TaxID=35708 RepID=A0A0A9HML8_ARUDO